MRTLELCAGAGGQALGLHKAGFQHSALVEIDPHACATLRHNIDALQLGWGTVIEGDLRQFAESVACSYRDQIDLVAGGVPCPPFSKAGQQKGHEDDRDLFPDALKVVSAVSPLAVMIENVAGIFEAKFATYRKQITSELEKMGYEHDWRIVQASDFGVPQLRPRSILIAIKREQFGFFRWPKPTTEEPVTVGNALYDLMASKGWKGAKAWKRKANAVAPTLVGGSKKHGGPDLGPTRAKRQWQALHVNGHRVGGDDEIPGPDFKGVRLRDGSIREGLEDMPLLNVRMAARLQGFPDSWKFIGSKTNAYRQVGNAFPPPVAEALGKALADVIEQASKARSDAA